MHILKLIAPQIKYYHNLMDAEISQNSISFLSPIDI